MTGVLSVFDPLGHPLTQLDTAVVRSYITNNFHSNVIGTGSFRLARTDYKHQEKYLTIGNMVRVHDEDDDAEDWVGFIDDLKGLKWTDGELTVGLVAAEKILEWREMPQTKVTGNSRTMLRNALEIVEHYSPQGLQLELGNIYATKNISSLPTAGTLLSFVNSVSKFAGGIGGPVCDYEVVGVIDKEDGCLHLKLNLFEGERGENTGLWLTDADTRLMDEGLTIQGEIWNDVYVYSKASSQGGRKIKHAQNARSGFKHGWRMKSFEGVGSDNDGLLYQARAYLSEHAWPTTSIPISISKESGLTKSVRRGNIFHYKSDAHGFDGIDEDVRVMAYEIDDEENSEIRLTYEAYYHG